MGGILLPTRDNGGINLSRVAHSPCRYTLHHTYLILSPTAAKQRDYTPAPITTTLLTYYSSYIDLILKRVFARPISEKEAAAAAEAAAGSTQHVEQVTSIGPWSLRRDSSPVCAAVNSPGAGRSRRGTASSAIGSPSMGGGARSRDPFSKCLW